MSETQTPVPSLVDLARAAVEEQVTTHPEARSALLAVLAGCDRLYEGMFTRSVGRDIARRIAFSFDVRLPAGHPDFDAYYDASDEALAGIHLTTGEHRDGCAR